MEEATKRLEEALTAHAKAVAKRVKAQEAERIASDELDEAMRAARPHLFATKGAT